MNRPFRIMVIEDSGMQALKLRRLLESQGWQVSTAGAAEAALSELRDPFPDVILVDYNLPGMRGDEFCRRVRMNLNARGIPILMMTASSPETAEIVSLESGADDYISKFESADIFLLRVRALLRKVAQPSAILTPQDFTFRRAHILTIDGNSSCFTSLGEELRNQGYTVESATGASTGLSRVATGNFDCVLLDLAIPEIDGIEVCRRISAMRSPLDSGPAVILIADREDKGDMNRAFEAGADDYVTKSGDVGVLRARVQALMRRRFFQEESGRIVDEFKARERETLNARAGREIAEARVAMAEKLVQADRDLRDANQKLHATQIQLIQNEKMASLGQLVAGIAHEINNPLAFVVNNLFIVENGLDALRPEVEPHLSEVSLRKLRKVRERLGEMKAGMDRVKELVLDLRTFSRLDQGEFKTVDVVEMIDTVLLLFKHKMHGLIRVEKYFLAGRTLSGHAGRLQQVLMNLLGNAVDAIGGAGTITITTSQTPEDFLISVRDTGPGIPESVRNKIFDPFFTTKGVGQGTGLGLAISYGIVQDHNGSIEVRSEEGVGTEFVVRIPLHLKSRNGN